MKPLFAVALAVLSAGCAGRDRSVGPEERWSGHIVTVQSAAFAADAPIPKKHAARDEGDNVSPLITWSNPPPGVEEWAVVCEDRDASGGTWVHWVVYAILKDAKGLPEGLPRDEELSRPAGARQGENSWGDIGYGGPRPPKGDAPHRYRFIVYALKSKIALEPGATLAELREAMKGLVIWRGEIAGTYQR